MFIDALGLVSDAQAVVASAVSTNSIDHGAQTPVRDIGRGEPVGFGVQVDIAVSGTSFLIELIQATDAALTAGIDMLESYSGLAAVFPAASLHFLAIPPAAVTKRFMGLRYTVTGGATTVTVTSWFTTKAAFSIAPQMHAKNSAV